jgi:hypothetical protein
MLKGLGRVTDREFQALQSSVNAIDRSMSEDQFKSELNKIITTFENMKAAPAATAPAPSAVPSVGGNFNGEKVLKVEKVN